jgi:cytidylate kinase
LDHPAICLSRQIGAGARQIAERFCEQTGYELVGKTLIDELARDLKVQRWLIDNLDEALRNELDIAIRSRLSGHEIDNADYGAALKRVVRTFGRQGGVVLLGRGAANVLCDRSALNVLVTAPRDQRIRRVMSYQNINEAGATEIVRQFDRDREQFLRRHFDAAMLDPSLYDLCLDLHRLTVDAAVALILLTLDRRGYPLDRLRIPEKERTQA